jgi:hypothetical protein
MRARPMIWPLVIAAESVTATRRAHLGRRRDATVAERGRALAIPRARARRERSAKRCTREQTSAGTHIMQARASERATRVLVVSIETVVSRLSSFCSMPAFATCAARRSARRTAASAARRAWQCWACCNLRAERIVHIVGVGTRATATAHVCGSLTTPTRGQSLTTPTRGQLSTLPSPPCSRRRARMRARHTLRTARARARSRGRAARAPPTRIRTAAAARAARQPARGPGGRSPHRSACPLGAS